MSLETLELIEVLEQANKNIEDVSSADELIVFDEWCALVYNDID